MKGQRKLSKQEVQRLTKRLTRIGQQGIENSDPAFLEALNQEVRVDYSGPKSQVQKSAFGKILFLHSKDFLGWEEMRKNTRLSHFYRCCSH